MFVLKDSHRGIVPATVVYVYTSNAICSFFHEFPVNSSRVTRVQMTLNPHWSNNKQTHLHWRTENSISKPVFSVVVDG